MPPDKLVRVVDAIANQMQVVAGHTTELRRALGDNVQVAADLEASVDKVIKLLRTIQPKGDR